MEAAQLSQEDSNRFRVHREQNVVHFFGSLGDTPELSALDGILLDASICDLSQLNFASWIGLGALGSFIEGKALKLSFRHIPYQIYDSMRLMKHFFEQTLESAEMPWVDTTSGTVKMEYNSLRPLREAIVKGDEWFYANPTKLLLIPLRYIFPDFAERRSQGYLPLQVLTDQKEVASFWLKYGSFCQSTVEVSNSIIHAAQYNMMQILGEIAAKMSAGEQALKIIDSQMSYTLMQRIDQMIKDTKADFDFLSFKIQDAFDVCETKLASLTLKSIQQGIPVNQD